jgi:hypothetical protein
MDYISPAWFKTDLSGGNKSILLKQLQPDSAGNVITSLQAAGE